MNLSSLGFYCMVSMLGAASKDAPTQAPPERAAATDQRTPMSTGWGLGISGGITSGFGVSTRRHFSNRLGFQATALYLPLGEGRHWMSFGAQGFYTILRGRTARFYGLTGAHLVIDGSVPKQFRDRRLPTPYTTPPSSIWTQSLFLGLGLGLEFHFTRWIGWALEIPLSTMIALEAPRQDQTWKDKIRLVPAANMALTFYFM